MSDQRADEPLGADKQPSPPRVAQGEPVPAAGVTNYYSDCHIGHIGDNHHHYHASSGPAAVVATAAGSAAGASPARSGPSSRETAAWGVQARPSRPRPPRVPRARAPAPSSQRACAPLSAAPCE